jgi:hypothetical protein
MSINMKNPRTLLEKLDAAANLVAQMYLAHKVGDEKIFKQAHDTCSQLLFDAAQMADEQE